VPKLPQGAIPDEHLDVHLGFAFQAGHALAESPPIRAHGVLQRLIIVENRPKPERKHRTLPEAHAYHSGMLQNVLFFEIRGTSIEFTDDHGKLAAGIT